MSDSGERVLYTPETVVASPAPPLFGPHLRQTLSYGRRRGRQVRSRGLRALRPSTLLPVALTVFVLLGLPALLIGGTALTVWLVASCALFRRDRRERRDRGAARFATSPSAPSQRSGSCSRHVTYAWGFIRGLVEPLT